MNPSVCAPGPDGVVRSSALSFLDRPAQEQADGAPGETSPPPSTCGPAPSACAPDEPEQQTVGGEVIPPGLQALCAACARIYPTQRNPLQVTTRLKYWLGGQDPLDYISMYWNEGNSELRVPPHWHYISFGLSDLHGDGRVHATCTGVSGWGVELTLRVRASGEGGAPAPPPLWPAALMQALARYVFLTGNKLCAGDHISWHSGLDGNNSRLRHLLLTQDPQLPTANTPHGTVTFLQLVGCTSKELRAAQRGSAADVITAMREHKLGGGAWTVSDPRRRRSCVRAARGAPAAPAPPAHLAGVAAALRWLPMQDCDDGLSSSLEDRLRGELELGGVERLPGEQVGADAAEPRGHGGMSTDSITFPNLQGDMSTGSFEMSSMERALPDLGQSTEWWGACGEAVYLPGVHIQMNAESAGLIPLAINGRVLHGRHFTWQQAGGGGVTLVGEGVAGAAATARRPYAARGRWLQIYLTKDLALDIASHPWSAPAASDTETESEGDGEGGAPAAAPRHAPPYTREWGARGLRVTVLPDHYFC